MSSGSSHDLSIAHANVFKVNIDKISHDYFQIIGNSPSLGFHALP